jgi:hypothetical protein
VVFRQPLYKTTTLPLFDVEDTGNVVSAIFAQVRAEIDHGRLTVESWY